MGADDTENEISMAFLNGLPDQYAPVISALDAEEDDKSALSFDFVKASVAQKEQRIRNRHNAVLKKSEQAAMVSKDQRNRGSICSYCGKRGHSESKCWKKHPHLNPFSKEISTRRALVNIGDNFDEDQICLMTQVVRKKPKKTSNELIIDSGCTSHITYRRESFSTFREVRSQDVEVGNNQKSAVLGRGTVELSLSVGGKQQRVVLKDVLYVPDLGFQLISVATLDRQGMSVLFWNRSCRVV